MKYVDFETAVDLHYMGYNLHCEYAWYRLDGAEPYSARLKDRVDFDEFWLRPNIHDVADWIAEKYGLYIGLMPIIKNAVATLWQATIYSYVYGHRHTENDNIEYDGYILDLCSSKDEALNSAINKAVFILNN